MTPVSPHDVDLSEFIRPGDRVVVGQGAAEPQTLARLLVAQRQQLGGVEVFVGPGFTDVFAGTATDGLRFASYGALGTAAGLAASGRLDVLPMPYGKLCAAFADGTQRADVVMLQVSPALPGRGHGAGLSNDYATAAAARARVVILEVNPHVPWTHGGGFPASARIGLCVLSDDPPPLPPAGRLDLVEATIASRVASLVPDRAAVQVGVGALPNAVMAALSGHRGLGIHSGVMGDAAVALIEAGAVTNAHKEVDAGVSVTNTLFGTQRLYDFAHCRAAVQVRPGTYTHSLAIMAQLGRFTAINGGIEVDLGGQVNTETAGDRYIGALGGGLEFTRGAALSAGGRAVVALRSTTGGGAISRIVPAVRVATIPRADVDTIVTEHGVAELRGVSLRERARRLIAVAAPGHREDLARAVRGMAGCHHAS